MLVYRYEHLDGGGPFFNITGKPRYYTNQIKSDAYDYLYGCISIETLEEYFIKYVYYPYNLTKKFLLKNCCIKIYNIPDEEVILGKYSQVKFPKKYSNKGVKL